MDLTKITFPKEIIVTDQVIDISNLTESQKVYYLQLFEEILLKYEATGKDRMIIGLTGPTGSGKSVLVALFTYFSRQIELPFAFATVGIDAFHYPNEYLKTNKNREGKSLIEVKGSPSTYDVNKLVRSLTDFRAGLSVALPEYSRLTHNPIEARQTIKSEKTLIVAEGLWLLCEEDGWDKVSNQLDYVYYIEADLERVKESVLRRHEAGGRSAESAEQHYQQVDSSNYILVEKTKDRANKIIAPYYLP